MTVNVEKEIGKEVKKDGEVDENVYLFDVETLLCSRIIVGSMR
jgi:hypothetical protein